MLRQENVRNIKYHKIRNRKGTPYTVDTWPLYWKDETLIALDLCKSNCNVMQKSWRHPSLFLPFIHNESENYNTKHTKPTSLWCFVGITYTVNTHIHIYTEPNDIFMYTNLVCLLILNIILDLIIYLNLINHRLYGSVHIERLSRVNIVLVDLMLIYWCLTFPFTLSSI